MELKLLRTFLTVVELRHFGRAAHALHLSQPALSKQIAALEASVGGKLFERGRHGAVPTHEGQLFMPHASACVSALRQGVELLARDDGAATATVDIGVLPTVATALVPPVLRAFSAQWPRAIVRLTTASNAELLERLKAGEISFAVGRLADPERMVGLSFEQLYSEPLVVVVRAGHPLHDGAGLPARLADFPLVLPPFGTLIRQAADGLLAAWGAAPMSSFVEMLSVSVGRALALENDAVWFVPSGVVEYDLRHGALVRLPLPSAGSEEPVGLILRTDTQPSVAGRALIDAVRRAARERGGRAADEGAPVRKRGRRPKPR